MPTIHNVEDHSFLTDPFIGFRRYLTPHRFRRNERKVATLTDFEDVHRSIAQIAESYLDNPRSNYVRAHGLWLSDLDQRAAYVLSAANMEARIAYARVALKHLHDDPQFFREPLHFVTISPADYICPRETASRTNLKSLQKLTGQALAGLSFVGSTDFALFKSWGSQGIREFNNQVGPHTHNIVIGATRDQIEASLRQAGLADRGWRGNPAYHIRAFSAQKLEGYLLYLLKTPLFEYHAVEGARLYHGRSSAEMETHGRFPAYKLRTGDQVCMLAITSAMRLTELVFGQHAGTKFVRRVREEARGPLRHANELDRRKGQPEVPLNSDYRPEERPLLSDCVIHPPRWLQSLRRRTRRKAKTSDDHKPEMDTGATVRSKYLDKLNEAFDKLLR